MTPWPTAYRCVDVDGIAVGPYSLRPISGEDREPIRRWRNEQIAILRQPAPLTAADQDRYFEAVVRPQFGQEHPAQVLVALLEDGVLIGYGGLVHIAWPDRQAEVSFITETSRQTPILFDADLSAFLRLIAEVARRAGLNRLTTEVYSFRHDYIAVATAAGFVLERTQAGHVPHGDGFVDALHYGLRLADGAGNASLGS